MGFLVLGMGIFVNGNGKENIKWEGDLMLK